MIDEIRENYGKLDLVNDTCSDKTSYPIYFANKFCDQELDILNKLAKL